MLGWRRKKNLELGTGVCLTNIKQSIILRLKTYEILFWRYIIILFFHIINACTNKYDVCVFTCLPAYVNVFNTTYSRLIYLTLIDKFEVHNIEKCTCCIKKIKNQDIEECLIQILLWVDVQIDKISICISFYTMHSGKLLYIVNFFS